MERKELQAQNEDTLSNYDICLMASGSSSVTFFLCRDRRHYCTVGRNASQGRLNGQATCVGTHSPTLKRAKNFVSCSAITILKFLTIFKQEAPHFCFSQDHTNYAACPGVRTGVGLWVQIPTYTFLGT